VVGRFKKQTKLDDLLADIGRYLEWYREKHGKEPAVLAVTFEQFKILNRKGYVKVVDGRDMYGQIKLEQR
jgi:hypothetical protein